MQLPIFLPVFLFFLTSVSAGLGLTSPNNDDFYKPPAGYESLPLGTILKSRSPPAPIRSILFEVKVKDAWQLMVRSEDALGNPAAIVTTVFEPYNADPSKLVSYQVAEDASALKCSPSFGFLNGNGPENIVDQAEMFLIQTALDQGYYVNSPDYEGLNSAYTVGVIAGKSTLDSIRAVLHSKSITGLNEDAKVVLWGYSGGSQASGFAAAMQPSYAPDLKDHLKGAAMGGFVTNITATAVVTEGGIFAGLVATAITGLSNGYPDLKPLLQKMIFAYRWPKFILSYNNCLPAQSALFAFNRFFTGPLRYFKDGWGVLQKPEVKDIISKNTLGDPAAPYKPDCPIFVYHGKIDEIVPFKEAQRVYDVWCAEGMNSYEFAVSQSTGHGTEIAEGSGAALAWIKRAFAGDKLVQGCQRTERLSNLSYPGAITKYSDLIKALFKNIFGGDIGPNGENLRLINNQFIAKEAAPQSNI